MTHDHSRFEYDLGRTVEELRSGYSFDVSCQAHPRILKKGELFPVTGVYRFKQCKGG
ncbi:MAG: hypothetical protein HGJ94_17775 [Desulfosarcina sp.]|nr:hypothetical protein [Desulfosarcina sp.]